MNQFSSSIFLDNRLKDGIIYLKIVTLPAGGGSASGGKIQ